MDDKTRRVRKCSWFCRQCEYREGRISILTPMGAALYGLADGACISWPDLDGNERLIRVMRVEQRPDERLNAMVRPALLRQPLGDRPQAASDLIDEGFVRPRRVNHVS